MFGQKDVNIFQLYGQQKDAGAVSGALFPTNGIQLLGYAIGNDTVTGTGAPYSHTFAPANELHSMTLEKNIGGVESLQFAGAKVNKFSIKMDTTDTEVTFSADVIAQNAAVLTTPTTIAVTNELPFVFAQATVSLFGTQIYCTNVQLDIENGLKETWTAQNSHQLTFLTPLTRTITGSVDVVFDSLSDTTYGYYDKMMGYPGTVGALTFVLTQGTGTGLTSITINIPSAVLSKYADDIKFDSVIMSTLNFSGFYNFADSYSVQAVVQNAISTAY